MSLDHDFVQVRKLSKDQKKGFNQKGKLFSPNSGEDPRKKVFTKNGTFFPNLSEHLRADAHQSQIIGGDADVDHHTQTIGGDTVNLSPLGFSTPDCNAERQNLKVAIFVCNEYIVAHLVQF